MSITMKTHWSADIFALNESDIEALAADIKANGQVTPIKALKDGRIVDGRNRFLACQKVGISPQIDIINPDGGELTDEQICTLAISCNSMRRDETTSKRACAAAEMWKMLYPGETRGGDHKSENQNRKSAVSFERFAKDNFKAGERYAQQAQAILNYSAELFEDAKDDLAGTYKIYQERVSEDKEKRRNMGLLSRSENADLKQRVENGEITGNEAVTLVRERHQQEIARSEAEKVSRQAQRNRVAEIGNFLYIFGDTPAKQIAQIITPQDGEDYISDPGQQPLGKDELLKAATILTQIANEL